MGYVKTATGEFCMLAHVLEPLRHVTRDMSATDKGTTVVLFNEYYRPVGSPVRRSPRTWNMSVEKLTIEEKGTRVTLANGSDEEDIVVWPASDNPDRDLWESTRNIDRLIDMSTRAVMRPSTTLMSCLTLRSHLRPQLYAVGGDIRETEMYKRDLDRARALMLQKAVYNHFKQAYADWQYIRRYFPVRSAIRTGIEQAFDDENVTQIVSLANKIR